MVTLPKKESLYSAAVSGKKKQKTPRDLFHECEAMQQSRSRWFPPERGDPLGYIFAPPDLAEIVFLILKVVSSAKKIESKRVFLAILTKNFQFRCSCC